MSVYSKVRVTVTDGMGRKQVYEDAVRPADRTAGIAAHELIDKLYLRDGDTLEIDFLPEPEPEPA